MSNKTKFALFIAIFLWASAFTGIRAGLQSYSPEGLALLRYLVASVCMGIIYYRMPKHSITHWRDILLLFAIGAVGIGIYNVTLNYGELSISSGMASFITSQSPVITAILAVIFFGERLNLNRILGFIISVLGVALISAGELGDFKWDASLTYILLATLAGSTYSVLQKPFLKKFTVIEATTYVIWGGTLFLLIYSPNLKQDLGTASLRDTFIVIYLGVFPAALGYAAWSYVLTKISVARAASFLYLMPFLATLLGWVCLGEIPMMTSITGALLAIFGVWLVNHSYRRSTVAREVSS